MWDVTYSYVGRGTCIRAIRRIHMWDMTHSVRIRMQLKEMRSVLHMKLIRRIHSVQIIEMFVLVECGADPNAADMDEGWTGT